MAALRRRPLDLVHDFVITEIPERARDDIATPSELEGWLAGSDLLTMTSSSARAPR